MTHYVVYHEAFDGKSQSSKRRGPIMDGCLIVEAATPYRAAKLVEELMGSDFNHCHVELLMTPDVESVIVEFWRQAPKRPTQGRAPNHELDEVRA